jgi:acetyl-CoA carboxylase biotin carboxyl carrier protein
MEIKEIRELIKFVSQSGVSEVELEQGDFKLSIKNVNSNAPVYMQAPMQQMQAYQQPQVQQAPQISASAVESVSAPTPVSSEGNLITIKSPMIGTFYRSSSPDKPSFVNVGDEIKTGKVICIIEAMKLFNEIESEIGGKIVKVLVENAQPVEYDQPLFLVEPN